MKEGLVVKSVLTAKEAPGLKTIQHKAIAGISETELIERHTIGEYDEDNKGPKSES